MASSRGNIQILELLLKSGAHPVASRDEDMEPLEAALYFCPDPEAVQTLLLKYGAASKL